MAIFQDIILDDDLDLLIVDGDFVIGESINQEILLIINSSPGNWKQNPLVGVAINKFLASTGMGGTIRRNIEVGLQADGMTNVQVIVDETNLTAPGSFVVSAERNG